jgi:DNA-binding NarL/FixJ family response regulator
MCKSDVNLLIIEDSSISANAYATILSNILNLTFNIFFAKDCDEAIQKIKHKKFQLVMLDLQLPVSKNERYVCGEDLGLLIRKINPKTKIVVLTNITNQLRTQNIIEELNPEGFIIKTDIESKSLKKAVTNVLYGEKYYSKTVNGYTSKANLNEIVIDDFDRQILYHLSMGEKTKDIPKFVTLSQRAIEERKSKLKIALGIKSNNRSNLVKVAKKMGYV